MHKGDGQVSTDHDRIMHRTTEANFTALLFYPPFPLTLCHIAARQVRQDADNRKYTAESACATNTCAAVHQNWTLGRTARLALGVALLVVALDQTEKLQKMVRRFRHAAVGPSGVVELPTCEADTEQGESGGWQVRSSEARETREGSENT